MSWSNTVVPWDQLMGTIKDFLEMLLSCNGSKVKDWDLAAYESALQKAAYFPKVFINYICTLLLTNNTI
jgi:hypothetical protein